MQILCNFLFTVVAEVVCDFIQKLSKFCNDTNTYQGKVLIKLLESSCRFKSGAGFRPRVFKISYYWLPVLGYEVNHLETHNIEYLYCTVQNNLYVSFRTIPKKVEKITKYVFGT